ncbi:MULTISPECIES: glycosyltransferase family 2 protein [Enterobacter]|uniref:Glycosyltransferase family 2 protein n=1 Tax=Enterobacter dykesii TaxID=2797506 RepID=A0AAU7IX98_9ENTR|nr:MULTISPECIES: glycosyltransferase family 2 protein [Enterobacter]KAA0520385.1 glycosyltransferase family 2 protein [Enterobacter asburiae]KAA0529834.1 glycosyltransferase family 2 protein [Enterobacter dykesii]MCR6469193.1 glycosyltransferase family 2 protein [Enterobacter sp. HG048]MCV3770352.1 glycosyltransferase family 2 protein [Enterobacter sp. RD4-1-1]RTN75011.1 glycosyltransferase family 2 protein [Enterobacter asburiae]
MKKVGLVTVLFNSPGVLPDFYSSVEKQKYHNKHLYIVDNSTNQDSFNLTQEILLRKDIEYTYINNDGNNVGVAQANNQGIEEALKDGCEYILLTNNDLLFEQEDTLSKMMSVAEEGQYKLVSPVIFSYPEKKVWYAGAFFNKKKAIAPHLFEGADYDDIYANIPEECDYAPTCFLLVHASMFATIGMMDARYFAYYDDTDFLYRANIAGTRVRIINEPLVFHKVSTSTGGGLSLFGAYYLTRNRIFFARKNIEAPYYIVSVLFTIVTRLVYPLCRKTPYKVYKAFVRGIIDGLMLKNK